RARQPRPALSALRTERPRRALEVPCVAIPARQLDLALIPVPVYLGDAVRHPAIPARIWWLVHVSHGLELRADARHTRWAVPNTPDAAVPSRNVGDVSQEAPHALGATCDEDARFQMHAVLLLSVASARKRPNGIALQRRPR